jgi:broad specificity phosphatase PhoE
MGLMRFPCTEPLHNRYYFMRAGQSLLEEQDIWSTNPLFLTNREAALSQQGRSQVLQAVRKLQEAGIQPSQIRHSLAASAMDTAGMVRDEMKVGQNRINPEFVFMDPRAIGAWEGMSYQQTVPAVVALDIQEAGTNGQDGRPPPNDDGTPNETLFDQSTRLRQLMSALETQYSGDSILLVFPDGTGPALLSAMIAGIPLNQVHLLDYQPGEIRIDVTLQSTLDIFQQKQKEQATVDKYTATLQQGKEELERLRSMDSTNLVSKKDQLLEQEQLAIEKDYQQAAEARQRKEREVEQARLARQRDIQQAAETRRKKNELEQSSSSVQSSGKVIDGSTAVGGLVGGAVIVGVSVLAFGENDTGKETRSRREIETPVTQAEVNITLTKVDSNSTPLRMDTAGENSSSQVTRAREITNNGENNATRQSLQQIAPLIQQPPQTEKEKIDAARVAMEEYMNRDDGGDDWLSMLNEIIEEKEEILPPESSEESRKDEVVRSPTSTADGQLEDDESQGTFL